MHASCYLPSYLSAIPSIWCSIKLWELGSHLIPPPSLPSGEGSFIPGCIPHDDIVNSEYVMVIKAGDSGKVIGYKVENLPGPHWQFVVA